MDLSYKPPSKPGSGTAGACSSCTFRRLKFPIEAIILLDISINVTYMITLQGPHYRIAIRDSLSMYKNLPSNRRDHPCTCRRHKFIIYSDVADSVTHSSA